MTARGVSRRPASERPREAVRDIRDFAVDWCLAGTGLITDG